jgi:hypothetical protein
MVAFGVEIKPRLPVTRNITLAEAYIFFYLMTTLYATVEYLLVDMSFRETGKYDEMVNAADEEEGLNTGKRSKGRDYAVWLDRFSRWFVLFITVALNITAACYVNFDPALLGFHE